MPPTVTPSNSVTPTPSIAASVSTTPSHTPTPSVTPPPSLSISKTPSVTPSVTPSKTPAASVSATPSVTPTHTPSPTISPTPSPSGSVNVAFLAPEKLVPDTGIEAENQVDDIIVGIVPPSKTPSASVTPSPSVTPSVTPTQSVTPSVTLTTSASVTPTASPSRSPNPTPSITPSLTPSQTPAPRPISNTSFADLNGYTFSEIAFSNDTYGSNIPPYNKTGNEYVNNTIINKALMKLMLNNQSLANYLNFRFTGTLDPVTNNISSGDITPLSQNEKQLLSTAFNNNCFLNVNEKTSPQVLNRVFQCLYEYGLTLSQITNTKITNLDQLINSLTVLVPYVTPTSTPSFTPSASVTPTMTPTPSKTPSHTPSHTPAPTMSMSATPTPTPSKSPSQPASTCEVWLFTADNPGSSGTVTYTKCGSSSPSTNVIYDGDTICVKGGTGGSISASGGAVQSLGYNC
jgi:hypothetical protein